MQKETRESESPYMFGQTLLKRKMEINYDGITPYNTSKKPRKQWRSLMLAQYAASAAALIPVKHKTKKYGMEGVRPPYILLSNHHEFVDFEMSSLLTFPHRVNNICHIDGMVGKIPLMERLGCICKRKFTTDLHLIDSIDTVLNEFKGIISIYPEARYTPIGTLAPLPEALGRLVKRFEVPVVVILHHGNYLHMPFWDFRRRRKVPLFSEMKLILTSDQVKNMTSDEIYDTIVREMQYDEYDYQRENNIRITEPFRAEGLHKVLYQCPSCGAESAMRSEGTELYCSACGKRWEMDELGVLHAKSGKTEFPHIPDWFEWERMQVREQIYSGTYSYSDRVEVYSLPAEKFVHLGFADVTHDRENGFIISGEYNGLPYRLQRKPLGMYGLHVEYDHMFVRPDDCFEVSCENDSLFCYPSAENIITKLSFATEEIYAYHMKKRSERRLAKAALQT